MARSLITPRLGRQILTPTELPGCVLWLRPDPSVITLGPTPRPTGSAPPGLTISGALTPALGLHFEITTGGSLGTARFRWSTDNGATYPASNVNVATGPSVPLGQTGIIAAFMDGMYNVDNRYDATVASWVDRGGTNDPNKNFAQATAAQQPLYNVVDSVFNNRPTIQFGNAGVKTPLVSGSWYYGPHPATVYAVVAITGAGGQTVIEMGAQGARRLYGGPTSGSIQDGAGLGVTIPTIATKGVLAGVWNGTASRLYCNQSSIPQGFGQTGNPPTTINGPSYLGIDADLSTQVYLGKIAEIVACIGAHSSNEIAAFMRYAAQRYGIVAA